MSGLKYSRFELVGSDLQERDRLLSLVNETRRAIGGVDQEMERVRRHSSDGVRVHFAQIDRAALQCREMIAIDSSVGFAWSLNQDVTTLSQGLVHLQQILQEATQAYLGLLDAYTNRAPRIRNELSRRQANLAGAYDAHRDLILEWLGELQLEPLEGILDQARRALVADDFSGAEHSLGEFDTIFTQAAEEARQKEAEHTRREQFQRLIVLRRDVGSVHQGVHRQLEAITEGLRAMFPAEVDEARDWLNASRLALDSCPGDPDHADGELLALCTEQLDSVLRRCEAVKGTIHRAFTEEADRLRVSAEAKLSSVAVLLGGNRERLGPWFDNQEIVDLENALIASEHKFVSERYREVEAPCEELEKRLRSMIVEADELGKQNERRLHVLNALRESCRRMNWGEVEEPRLEREGDNRSRYRLTFNTYGDGHVTFHLTLDSIHVDSCMAGEHCFDEFDRLSSQLKERFSIDSKFLLEEGGTRPKDKESAAVDLPRGGKTASAG